MSLNRFRYMYLEYIESNLGVICSIYIISKMDSHDQDTNLISLAFFHLACHSPPSRSSLSHIYGILDTRVSLHIHVLVWFKCFRDTYECCSSLSPISLASFSCLACLSPYFVYLVEKYMYIFKYKIHNKLLISGKINNILKV